MYYLIVFSNTSKIIMSENDAYGIRGIWQGAESIAFYYDLVSSTHNSKFKIKWNRSF